MSVSDLVRRHLAKHFPASTDGSERPDFLDETYGWSDVVVAQETRCTGCGKALPAYDHAWLAQGPPPPTRFVCTACYDEFQTLTKNEEPQEMDEGNEA